MAAQLRRGERRQGARSHGGAEVRPADADVDDVGHWLTESASHASFANVRSKAQHLFACVDDLGHHVLAVDPNRLAGEIAQGSVKDGPLLGDVDLLAGEHRLTLGFELAGFGELDERAQDASVNALLGIVEQKIVEGDAELLKSCRIVSEILPRRSREHAVAHAGQFRQCR